MDIAHSQDKIHEFKGDSENNPEILKYWYAVDDRYRFTKDEVSWCSAFVNWVFFKYNMDNPNKPQIERTHMPNAKSWLDWGVSVKKDPFPGAVAIFWRGSPKSWQGHVAFWEHKTALSHWVFGGNQKDSVCLEKYPKWKLLDIRAPIYR
jgi:uncharacterized protein (TIGR02594 family)